MIGPNLSDWALKHRSFVIFAMIAIVVAGWPPIAGWAAAKTPPSPSAP